MTHPPLPTFADVRAAAARLDGHAVRTPLLSCPALDALTGGTVRLKAEPLQRTGSFKFRGAGMHYRSWMQTSGRAAWWGFPRAIMRRAWPRRRGS